MKSYNVPHLSTKTSKEDRARLVTAVEEVHGVKKVILHADSNSFQIETEVKQHPTLEDIVSAASSAGFSMPGN